MSASNSMTSDASGIEEITSGLNQTVLADHTVTTSPAVAQSTNPAEMDEIANCLGQTILGRNADQSFATLSIRVEEAIEEENPKAEGDPAGTAEKGKGRQSKEEEEEIDALGAAWCCCSLENGEEARA